MNTKAALAAARLYTIFDTGYVPSESLEKILSDLLSGGADIIQIRAKNLPKRDVLQLGKRARSLLRGYSTLLIINDYADVAQESGADGVHLGQEDGDLLQIRSTFPTLLIGRSTHSLQQAKAAEQEGADYIGFGPLFPTPTKAGRPAIGLGDLAELHRTVQIPVFAIGGIKYHNLPQVHAAGARRVVLVSGILQAANIVKECQRIKALLQAESFDDIRKAAQNSLC